MARRLADPALLAWACLTAPNAIWAPGTAGACQVLHRTAKARAGESVLVHGAAGRVGGGGARTGRGGRAAAVRDGRRR
jgi:hypothetical protein